MDVNAGWRQNLAIPGVVIFFTGLIFFIWHNSWCNTTSPDAAVRPLPITVYSDVWYNIVRATQRRRQKLLAKMCEKYFPPALNETSTRRQRLHYPKMYSSDNQRFLYCIVPKVACTSWKRVLSQANGASPDIAVHSRQVYRYVDLFSRLSRAARRRVLDDYFKFMFVRHPFERLVSAHHNKLVHANNSRYFQRIAADIKRKYRAADMRSDNDDEPVTFNEFVQHIIDPRTRRPLDRHWRPYHQLCQPCRIHYDFIGHYETLATDSRYVLSRLGIRDVQLPQPRARHNSSERVAELFAQLTPGQLQRLIQVYRPDFALFGYSANVSSLQA